MSNSDLTNVQLALQTVQKQHKQQSLRCPTDKMRIQSHATSLLRLTDATAICRGMEACCKPLDTLN